VAIAWILVMPVQAALGGRPRVVSFVLATSPGHSASRSWRTGGVRLRLAASGQAWPVELAAGCVPESRDECLNFSIHCDFAGRAVPKQGSYLFWANALLANAATSPGKNAERSSGQRVAPSVLSPQYHRHEIV